MQHITPEQFAEIQEMVTAYAPRESKIERDAFAMLAAALLNEYRTEEASQQRPGKKRRKRAA